MILKIIPIRNYTGLKRCDTYTSDKKKVIQSDTQSDKDNVNLNGIVNALKYAANKDKIKKIYRSGYLCDPDFASNEFEDAREKSLLRLGKYSSAEKNEIVAYHIIQSFEDKLDISDDEVHQCGLEFMEKFCKNFGDYQGIVNSHLHPSIDEEGIVHGKQKHNHIIINAYGLDPEKQYGKGTRRIKYHDCKENYIKLQQINDEISIAHGLPIILNPDTEKNNSWKEMIEIKAGNSWKENVRHDIDNMKNACHTWNDFVNGMKAAGYSVKENKYVTYTTPDKKHKVRDKTLGREYTKETIEMYWKPIKNFRDTFQITAEELQKLNDEAAKNNENLYVKIVKNNEFLGQNNYNFTVPLNEKISRKETYNSYFALDKSYRIFDESNKKIMTVSGKTLRLYFEKKNNSEQEKKYAITGRYFYNHTWTDSKNRPYRVGLYDSDGRRRSLIELMLLLAIQIIESKYQKSHGGIKTNYKLQNMIDAVSIAREKNVRTYSELTENLNIAGKTCSRLKAQIKKNDSVYNKYLTLNKTLSEFLSVKDFCESFSEVSDKTSEIKNEYSEKIKIYKQTKSILYKYNLTDNESIEDFKSRLRKSEELKTELSKKYATASQNYGDLKKLQHQINAATDKDYVYDMGNINREQNRNSKEFDV